jgi:hypothetical protein
MVGAGQHEQPGGDKVVAGVDTRRPRAGHWACGDRRSPPSFEHTFHERQGLASAGLAPVAAAGGATPVPGFTARRRDTPDGAGRCRTVASVWPGQPDSRQPIAEARAWQGARRAK